MCSGPWSVQNLLLKLVVICVQVLVRLCSRPSPAEELARKDDLTLLFSAITSWCPVHNVPWRKSAAEVLMTLSRHGLTPNVVQYIHSTYLSSLSDHLHSVFTVRRYALHGICDSNSVCLSVCLSQCPHGSTYDHDFFTIW